MNDRGIGNWVSMHALRAPERVALIDGNTGQRTSYAQLEARSNALGDALRARGVRKGDRVALVLLNSPQFMEIVLALAKLGAIAVPINFRLTAPEIQYILQDSAACLAFACPQTLQATRQAIEDSWVRELIEVPSAEQRVAGTGSTYEELIASGNPDRVEIDISEDEVVSLMYTSGTTGFPKGTMLTHRNHLWNAINTVGTREGLTSRDVSITAAPLFHIGAFGIHVLPLTFLGGSNVILESFTPQGWLDAVEQYRPTVAFCVPAMWAAIHSAGLGGRDLSSLRFSVSGGGPCPVVLIEALRAHGMVFTEGFGLTETAPSACMLDADEVIDHAGSIGKPLNYVEMRVADDEGRELPDGEVGELLLRGPSIFVGYWQKPEATRQALRDGWFFSGDLARRDADGYFYIVDRKKDMVITGGENVYPAEVEQVIYRHQAVAEVAVIGIPDEKWGEAVTAVVALKPDATLDEAALVAWTRERLAGFKCPRRVHFVEVLPRTATGKVLKRKLRQTLGGSEAAVHR